jgi:hypothetical protein
MNFCPTISNLIKLTLTPIKEKSVWRRKKVSGEVHGALPLVSIHVNLFRIQKTK